MTNNASSGGRIFSGIQPSGLLHVGNYLGAIRQWVDLQNDYESIFCVVDLHAITVPQKPDELRENILKVAAIYLACGIDPNKSKIFVQSSRPEHSELMWILNTITSMGELSRMTQFKEKAGEKSEQVSGGLFTYPVLMAADILLYDTTVVPVGEDQKQHVELARNLAERFNKKFSETFTLPEPMIRKQTARIMGLDDPTKKMSKSAASAANYISILDEPEVIRQKIARATTDSGKEIKYSTEKPGISNLLNIYCALSDVTTEQAEQEFSGKTYSEFKSIVSDKLIEKLSPIQEKYNKLCSDDEALIKIMREGSEAVSSQAKETIKKVQKAVGLFGQSN